MRRTLLAGATSLIALAPACGGTPWTDDADDEGAVVRLRETVSVSFVQTELVLTASSALSPSGDAIVAPRNGQWCLEPLDGSAAPICVAAGTAEATDPIAWRPDEHAVVVTDRNHGTAAIVDFETGSAIDIDLTRRHIWAWSPDGSELIGISAEAPDTVVTFARDASDPNDDEGDLTAEVLTDLPAASVPQALWSSGGHVWLTDGERASVHVLDVDTNETTTIDVGQASQRILDLSADGSIMVSRDVGLVDPEGNPIESDRLFVADADTGRTAALPPLDFDPDDDRPGDVQGAQISDDGDAVAAIVFEHDLGEVYLAAAPIEPESLDVGEWVEVTRWSTDDVVVPVAYWSSGDSIVWNGGPARVLTTSGMIEVAFTPDE